MKQHIINIRDKSRDLAVNILTGFYEKVLDPIMGESSNIPTGFAFAAFKMIIAGLVCSPVVTPIIIVYFVTNKISKSF